MINWVFDDPFHKKGPVLVILVPGKIKPSVPVSSLRKRTVEVDEASEVAEDAEVN